MLVQNPRSSNILWFQRKGLFSISTDIFRAHTISRFQVSVHLPLIMNKRNTGRNVPHDLVKAEQCYSFSLGTKVVDEELQG